jgi:formylglycine-generating enzyme required for sulfatase activity
MSLDESYRALGLEPGASLQEARRAYYRLLKFFHPDRHQGSPGLLGKATEETKKLNLAYERIRKVSGGGQRLRAANPKRSQASRAEASGGLPIPGQAYVVPSCGIKLNWVAPGHFKMGSPVSEAGRSDDEGPQTLVTISRGFWLGIFPVTQEEWRSLATNVDSLKVEPSFFLGTNLPVEEVSWNDCQAWLRELNATEESEHRLPRNLQYRLPTEAEWEFACRAGTSTRFSFGDADATLEEHAWYSANSVAQTHSVGQKKANAWGFYDMHGNVWEWCQDRYGPLPGGSAIDPTGPVLGPKRVLRGGSWGVSAGRCRSAYRVWNDPDYRDFTLGFRVALAEAD